MRDTEPELIAGLMARYSGQDGRRLLCEALLKQPLIEGRADLAFLFADASTLRGYKTDDPVIVQGHSDTDFFFILIGSVNVSPGGRTDTSRSAGSHVGEMATIDPTVRRSADVNANEPTILACVSEMDFARIATANPTIWRHLACELANRLRERTGRILPKRSMPRVFIASSKESLVQAEALRASLSQDVKYDVVLWTNENIFIPGLTNIEALEAEMQRADFAVLFLTPDDLTASRGRKNHSPRDNVIFELGLFVGAFGRSRALMAIPNRLSLKIPSDLLGVTPIQYDAEAMSDLAAEIHAVLDRQGAR